MIRPTGRSIRLSQTRSISASAPGPVTAILPNEERSMIPTRSRNALCSEPIERQASGYPEAGRPGHRSEERITVGRHRVRVAEQANHSGALEEREASDRPLEQRGETVHV